MEASRYCLRALWELDLVFPMSRSSRVCIQSWKMSTGRPHLLPALIVPQVDHLNLLAYQISVFFV